MSDQEFTFDKFMDDILLKEGQTKEKPREEKAEEKDPRRVLIERYTERAGNSIRYKRK